MPQSESLSPLLSVKNALMEAPDPDPDPDPDPKPNSKLYLKTITLPSDKALSFDDRSKWPHFPNLSSLCWQNAHFGTPYVA